MGKSILNGIGVIIDDQVFEEHSDIYKFKEELIKNNNPILCYDSVPEEMLLEKINDVSYIILDWNLNSPIRTENDEGLLTMPDNYKKVTEELVIDFILKMSRKLFIPIFIATNENKKDVEDSLKAKGVIPHSTKKNSVIFLETKKDIVKQNGIINVIEDLVKDFPSLHVLKQWEHSAKETKNELFLELFSKNPKWVSSLWDQYKIDAPNNYEYEFGSFISRVIVNKMGVVKFNEDVITSEKIEKHTNLNNVLELERYSKYSTDSSKQPQTAYTGDLFYVGENNPEGFQKNTYYLNIRAQCDLMRGKEGEEYNPDLYCIIGKKITNKNIYKREDVIFKEDEDSLTINGESILLIEGEKIAKKLNKMSNMYELHYGKVLEKTNQSIILCVDGGKHIDFNLNINIYKYLDIISYRKGRIVSPYIDSIQNKVGNHFTRIGQLSAPSSVVGVEK